MNETDERELSSRRDPDFVGAEAAMRRAARRARQRANAVATASDASGELSGGTRHAQMATASRVPRNLSFSQAQGYEEIPGALKLEELSSEARTRIWNVFYEAMNSSYPLDSRNCPWKDIHRSIHLRHWIRPLDEWDSNFEHIKRNLRDVIFDWPFNQVFDMIEFVMRYPDCPTDFASDMKNAFFESRLAYIIDDGEPPTIIPSATREEGTAVVDALHVLREAGLDGSASHLRNASECINRHDWAGSVRESIHAVESVARQLDPEASSTLGPALASLERRGALHPALKKSFGNLYGYASDEQGIRHPVLDDTDTKVDIDEAVFMLGACASFSSYLWRKHTSSNAP